MKALKRIVLLALILLVGLWIFALWDLHHEEHHYVVLSAEQQTQAAQYLTGKLSPEPTDWNWSSYTPEPGVNLRTGMVDADNAKGTVIVVPGFTATIEMTMREIAKINAAGYRVASIEYRGQGESWRPLANPEKGYVQSYEQLGAELAGFAKQVRLAGKPLFFYSISKGAHITMRMATEQDLDVSAYALIVPMIKINTGSLNYEMTHIFSALFSKLGLGAMYAPGQTNRFGNGFQLGTPIPCNANPDTAQTQDALFAQRELLRASGATMQWLYETTSSTEHLLKSENIAKITQPVMMVTAGIDALVDTNVAQGFCSSLRQCELTHIEQARHCITRENFDLYDGLVAQAIEHFNLHRQANKH
jgi:lysophospholipase